VDTREYDEPEPVQSLSGESPRDWGSLWSLTPSVSYQSTDGPILGVGRSYERFGFRQHPYEFRLTGSAHLGLFSGALALRSTGDFRKTASPGGYSFELVATQLDPIRFHGFGNDTDASGSSSFYVVRQNRLLGRASWYREFGSSRFSIGPIAKYTRTQLPEGTPFAAAHSGGRDFGQVGAHSELVLDWRDAVLFPRQGGFVVVGGTGYPGVWGPDEPFGEAHAIASGYLTPSMAGAPTLAVRLGGKQLWGDFPIHEAAFLGGSATVRGYSFERFAGDALLFGNAEGRLPLGRAKLVVRGDLGVLALADAGRVYLDGESPEGWHTAFGGGLWFRFQIRSSLIATSASIVRGERSTLYLKLGLPF
jgi:outer membrane translocation and assembly module TamA